MLSNVLIDTFYLPYRVIFVLTHPYHNINLMLPSKVWRFLSLAATDDCTNAKYKDLVIESIFLQVIQQKQSKRYTKSFSLFHLNHRSKCFLACPHFGYKNEKLFSKFPIDDKVCPNIVKTASETNGYFGSFFCV